MSQTATSYQMLYVCDLTSDVDMVADLKRVDAQLSGLMIKTIQLRSAHQRFVRACRSLNGNLNQEGPKMEMFRTRSYEMGILKGQVSDLVDALRAPDAVRQVAAAQKKIRQDDDAACGDEVRYMKVELLKQADAALNEAQVDCGPVR